MLTEISKQFLSDEDFDEIYKSIAKHWKDGVDKQELHCRLALIVAAVPTDVMNKEYGPSHAENTKLINRLKNNISNLIETLEEIDSLYPELSDGEGRELCTQPDWLFPHTVVFNKDNLRAHHAALGKLYEYAQEHSEGGTKKPRYSGRPHYIKALINVFEEFTNLEASTRRNDSTPFTDFATAFFYFAPVKIKNKDKISAFVLHKEIKK